MKERSIDVKEEGNTTIVIGTSGSGKTTYLKEVIKEATGRLVIFSSEQTVESMIKAGTKADSIKFVGGLLIDNDPAVIAEQIEGADIVVADGFSMYDKFIGGDFKTEDYPDKKFYISVQASRNFAHQKQ